jgi:hypothetical protein
MMVRVLKVDRDEVNVDELKRRLRLGGLSMAERCRSIPFQVT